MTSGLNVKGRFGKQDFVYVAADDVYLCPAGEQLTYHYTKAQASQQTSSSSMGGILERSVLEPLSSQLNGMFTGLIVHENKGCDLMNAARTRLSKRQMEVLKLLGKRGNSLRAIAADLAARGYVKANGKQFSAASVASMLGA
jgi:hypothetical protein